MNYQKIILEILVNGIGLYFLVAIFLNIDLIKIPQILLISFILMNGYLINKKVLRSKECNISMKQTGIAFGMSLVCMIILLILQKIF